MQNRGDIPFRGFVFFDFLVCHSLLHISSYVMLYNNITYVMIYASTRKAPHERLIPSDPALSMARPKERPGIKEIKRNVPTSFLFSLLEIKKKEDPNITPRTNPRVTITKNLLIKTPYRFYRQK